MTLYDELVARGLIAQVTDEEEIKELINKGRNTNLAGVKESLDRWNRRLKLYGAFV